MIITMILITFVEMMIIKHDTIIKKIQNTVKLIQITNLYKNNFRIEYGTYKSYLPGCACPLIWPSLERIKIILKKSSNGKLK